MYLDRVSVRGEYNIYYYSKINILFGICIWFFNIIFIIFIFFCKKSEFRQEIRSNVNYKFYSNVLNNVIHLINKFCNEELPVIK